MASDAAPPTVIRSRSQPVDQRKPPPLVRVRSLPLVVDVDDLSVDASPPTPIKRVLSHVPRVRASFIFEEDAEDEESETPLTSSRGRRRHRLSIVIERRSTHTTVSLDV
eukprot:2302053-Prymnesium_polylepis.1